MLKKQTECLIILHFSPLASFPARTDFCYQLLSRSTNAQTMSPDQRHLNCSFWVKWEHRCMPEDIQDSHMNKARTTLGSTSDFQKVIDFFFFDFLQTYCHQWDAIISCPTISYPKEHLCYDGMLYILWFCLSESWPYRWQCQALHPPLQLRLKYEHVGCHSRYVRSLWWSSTFSATILCQ